MNQVLHGLKLHLKARGQVIWRHQQGRASFHLDLRLLIQQTIFSSACLLNGTGHDIVKSFKLEVFTRAILTQRRKLYCDFVLFTFEQPNFIGPQSAKLFRHHFS